MLHSPQNCPTDQMTHALTSFCSGLCPTLPVPSRTYRRQRKTFEFWGPVITFPTRSMRYLKHTMLQMGLRLPPIHWTQTGRVAPGGPSLAPDNTGAASFTRNTNFGTIMYRGSPVQADKQRKATKNRAAQLRGEQIPMRGSVQGPKTVFQKKFLHGR